MNWVQTLYYASWDFICPKEGKHEPYIQIPQSPTSTPISFLV